jgi:hypothetical protein
MALNVFEGIMQTGFLAAVGNPAFLGLFMIGAFAGVMFILPTRTDVKIMVLVPVALMACSLIPVLIIPVALLIVALLVFAFSKFVNR